MTTRATPAAHQGIGAGRGAPVVGAGLQRARRPWRRAPRRRPPRAPSTSAWGRPRALVPALRRRSRPPRSTTAPDQRVGAHPAAAAHGQLARARQSRAPRARGPGRDGSRRPPGPASSAYAADRVGGAEDRRGRDEQAGARRPARPGGCPGRSRRPPRSPPGPAAARAGAPTRRGVRRDERLAGEARVDGQQVDVVEVVDQLVDHVLDRRARVDGEARAAAGLADLASSRCGWGSASHVDADRVAGLRRRAATTSPGRATIRCTSTRPPAAWIGSGHGPRRSPGPRVRLGTKWPSMTSTWKTRAPAASSASSWSPTLRKSADMSDGSTEPGASGSSGAHTGSPRPAAAPRRTRPCRRGRAGCRSAPGSRGMRQTGVARPPRSSSARARRRARRPRSPRASRVQVE